MNWTNIKANLRGAWKSWTVWVAVLFGTLPETLPIVQTNFPAFAHYIPDALESQVMHAISLIMVLLRIKTTTSLAGKAAPK